MLVSMTIQELVLTALGYSLIGMCFSYLLWIGLIQGRTSYWAIALAVAVMFSLVYLWLS